LYILEGQVVDGDHVLADVSADGETLAFTREEGQLA
jgi:hypothetical protein